MGARGVTVMLHRDGALESRQFRVPGWGARLALVVAVALVVSLALLGILYGPTVAAAARTPFLEREVEQLRIENARVNELARRLDEVEARYAQMRSMLGANVALPGTPGRAGATSTPNDEGLYVAPAIQARAPAAESAAADTAGPSLPRRWPLSVPSFRTRGLALNDPGMESHAGLDLAVPLGSEVRASGGGRVREAGTDPAYGLYVLLEHPDGYQTMYGHLSRLVVLRGAAVRAGQVIALSGNSGRSTAPHLHFEVRRGGHSIDPLSMVKEGN